MDETARRDVNVAHKGNMIRINGHTPRVYANAARESLSPQITD